MSAGSRRDRAHRGRDVPQPSRKGQARGGVKPDAIERLLDPVVTAAGYDLENVTVTPAGKRSVLRVVVDADGGISLDDVALVSRTVSETLDASDVMRDRPYVLEVTSPGVDRPLSDPRHWRRVVGRLVRVPLTAGGQIKGRVVSADDEAVVFDVAGASQPRSRGGKPEPELRRMGMDELGRGHVLVEFRRDDDGDLETDGE